MKKVKQKVLSFDYFVYDVDGYDRMYQYEIEPENLVDALNKLDPKAKEIYKTALSKLK